MQGDNKLLGEDKGRCHSGLAGERDGKNERLFCLMRGWCSEMCRFRHSVVRNTWVTGEWPRVNKESQNNSSQKGFIRIIESGSCSSQDSLKLTV